MAEPLKTWSPCIAVNGIEYYNHPAIPEWQGSVLMAVLGGLSGQYERLSVLHMSADGLAVESEDQFFASFNQRVRDVAINPYTGSVYLAFNGPQYPGSRPQHHQRVSSNGTNGVMSSHDAERGLDVFPNPATDFIQFQVAPIWSNRPFQFASRQWDSGTNRHIGQWHGLGCFNDVPRDLHLVHRKWTRHPVDTVGCGPLNQSLNNVSAPPSRPYLDIRISPFYPRKGSAKPSKSQLGTPRNPW